jgi:hypothetical protein
MLVVFFIAIIPPAYKIQDKYEDGPYPIGYTKRKSIAGKLWLKSDPPG